MKISQMSNDQAANVLVKIADPISHICDDEELVAMFDEFSKMENMGMLRAIGRILPKLVGYALKKHKSDVYEIIGALDGKTVDEVAKMNFAETVKFARESYDDVLKDFFTHSATVESVNETASHD